MRPPSRLIQQGQAAGAALLACLLAIIHLVKRAAVDSTCVADVCTGLAQHLMQGRTTQHGVGGGLADLGAGQHQRDVIRCRVRAAQCKAMPGGHLEAGIVTLLAVVDALQHFV